MNIKTAITASAILLISASCVRDGASGLETCEYPLRLNFSYTYNREGRDLLREEVPSISLRLFDTQTGAFVKGTDISVSDLDADGGYVWRVPAGRFSLVSWGGADSRYRLSTTLPIDSHTLELPAGADGFVPHERKHLWHNLTTDILINGDLTPSYDIDLHKISNDVTVTVTSVPSPSPRAVDAPAISRADGNTETPDASMPGNLISVTHSLYGYTGAIHPSASLSTYIPASVTDTPGRETHSYTTLGLSREDDSRLRVSYAGKEIYDGPLTALIARQPDIVFDLDDDFRLDFEVAQPDADGSAAVSVAVNGWHIHDYNVSLK